MPEQSLQDLINAPPDPVPENITPSIEHADDLQSLINAPPDPDVPLKTSSTGLTKEPLQGWAVAYKGLSDRFTLGAGAINKGLSGWNLAIYDDVDFEQAKSTVETQAMLQAQQDKEDYANDHGYFEFANMKVSAADLGGGWLAEQLPTLGLGGGAALIGGGVAAVAGAPIAVGALGGAALLFGTLGAGQAVYDLTQHGVNRNTARLGGLVSGVANAALTYMGGAGAAKGVTGAAAAMLEQAPVKEALMATTKRMAESMGVQIAAGEAGALVNGIVKYIATRTSIDATPYTNQQAIDEFLQASLQTMVLAPTITASGEGAGAALGKINQHFAPGEWAKAINKQLDKKLADLEVKRQSMLFGQAIKEAEAENPVAPKPVDQAEIEASPQVQVLDRQIEARRAANAKELERLLKAKEEIDAARAAEEQAQADNTENDFHGTSSKINYLGEHTGSGERNLFGPGFYVTASLNIAKQYTRKGRGTSPTVYKVKWLGDKPPKLLDLDKPLPKDLYEAFLDHEEHMPFPEELNNRPVTQLYAVFKEAMADNELYSSEAYERMEMLVERMKNAGFDGFTHEGGGRVRKGGERHQVKIYFDTTKLSIEELPPVKPKSWLETIDANDLPRKIEEANPVAPLIEERQRTVTELGTQAEAKALAEAVEKQRQAIAARVEKVFAPTSADEMKALIDKALLASRVLPGAGKKLLAAAKKAKVEGRELTEVETAALDKEWLLNMTPHEAKERLHGILSKYMTKHMPWARTAGYTAFNVAGKLGIVFQDVPNPEPLMRAFDPGPAVDRAQTLHRTYDDMLYDHLSKATGLSKAKVTDLGWKAAHQKIDVEYIGADNQRHPLKITADEAMSYLLWMKNTDALAALRDVKRGNGFTLKTDLLPGSDSTELVLQKALEDLNPNYVKALQGFETFYDEIGPIFKKVFEEQNPGVELNLQSFYGGTIRRRGMNRVETEDLVPTAPGQEFEFSGKSVGVNDPRFSRERGDSTVYIEPHGAFKNAADRTRVQAHYEAMVEPAKLWNALIRNDEFRYAVETKFGKHLYDSIYQSYKDVITGIPAAKQAYNGWVDRMMTSRSVIKLAAKPMQTLKHWTTLVNFQLYKYDGQLIPGTEFSKGVLDYLANKGKADKMILGWDEVKNRYASVEQISTVIKPESMSPTAQRVQHATMAFFAKGDKDALLPGVWSVYKFVLKKTGDKELAKAEAISSFRNVLASGALDQISDWQKGPILRLFAQFKQPEMRLAQHVLEAQRKAANFPTTENIQAALRVRFISSVSAMLFVLPETLLTVAFKPDQAEEAVFRMFQRFRLGNMFPALAEIATSTDTILHNAVFDMHYHHWKPTIGPLEAGTKTIDLVQDVIKLMEGEEDDQLKLVFKTALDLIEGPGNAAGIGVPETPIKFLRDLLVEREE